MKQSPASRREFLVWSAAGIATAQTARPPRILLRSSWQSINIGDVGHTPGALDLLAQYFPEAEVTLWPGRLELGARGLLSGNYPRLKIAEGSVDQQGRPSTAALATAWNQADLYLSGSGSGFPASAHAAAFQKATGKPVGVFGVSTDPISGIGAGREPEGGTLQQIRAKAVALPPTHLPADLRNIIDRASFFFCRDTISRDYLWTQGVKTPLLEFGPDAQLGMKLRDETTGIAFLQASQLVEGRFICVIPRLRYTPGATRDEVKEAINARTSVADHAKLRELITRYVKNTGHCVLACPEMTYQIALAKEALIDPLAGDVKKNVVWRDRFWMPDEAAAVYARAQAVVSAECHSPLIALHNSTPAFYVRQPTDTCKGQMYRDLGADDWLFEIDETSGGQLWSRLQTVLRDPAKAQSQVRSIMARVETRQKRMVEVVRSSCRRSAA